MADVPDLRFLFTVGTRPDDVPADDTRGLVGTDANGIPDAIDGFAEEAFGAFEEYGELGYHWNSWYDDHPLTVGVWDIDRSHVSFWDDDTDDLAGRHPITLAKEAEPSTVRHEVFHVVQYDYVHDADLSGDDWMGDFLYQRSSTAWFLEATAEWAASEVAKRRGLDDADDPPSGSIDEFLSDPAGRLVEADDRREYGAVAFIEYLEERLGTAVVRQVWEDIDAEETAEEPDEAIDFIAARAAAADEPLDELMPGFWAAAYLLTNSNVTSPTTQIPEETLRPWRTDLDAHGPTQGDTLIPQSRATRASLTVSATATEAALGEPAVVRAGGALFVDVVPDGVTGSIAVEIEGQYGGDTAVVVMPYGPAGFPYLCTPDLDPQSDGYQVHDTDIGGDWEATITVTDTCPTFSLALVHTGPQHYDSTAPGGPDETFTHVGVTITDPAPLDQPPWDLDPTFGGVGSIELPAGFNPDFAFTDDQDRVIVASTSVSEELEVARYLSDGRPDPSFGTSGLATHEIPTGSGALKAIEAHQDGYAFVFGDDVGDDLHLTVGRLRGDGSLDPGFDGDGIATFDHPGRDLNLDAEVAGTGLFISATARIAGKNVGPLLGRVHLSGSDAGQIDTDFGDDGWVEINQNPDGITDAFGGVEIFGSRALVGAYDYSTQKTIVFAFDINDGSIDTTYGLGGVMSTSGFAASEAHHLQLHKHLSHVLITDRTESRRVTSSGVLDESWGSTGVLTWPDTLPIVDTFLDHTYTADRPGGSSIIVRAYTDDGSADTDYWGDGTATIESSSGPRAITESHSELGGFGIVVATSTHLYRLAPSAP